MISERRNVVRYRIRSVPGGYAGDWVESHSRTINGTVYDFVRIHWADGAVSVTAYSGITSGPGCLYVHNWEG